jgi:hypothetical protein
MKDPVCPVCGVDHNAQPGHNPEEDMALLYKPALPMFSIPGSDADKAAFTAAFLARWAQPVDTLAQLASRNREKNLPHGRQLQNYYCIGCDVGDGDTRRRLLSLVACPSFLVVLQEHLGKRFSLQCFFKQTYEEAAGPGPGGIIGVNSARDVSPPDTSASRSWKYFRWVENPDPAYQPEGDAETELWRLTFSAFSEGKHWLKGLPQNLPAEGLPIPPEMQADALALLGITALQRTVAKHLGRDLVLLTPTRVTLRDNLHWQHATAALHD